MKKFRIGALALLLFFSVQSYSGCTNSNYCFAADQNAALEKPEVSEKNKVSEKPKASLYANKGFVARKYILGPNDVINISIYNVPELNQEKIRVQPDGKIILTPLGTIEAAGLSIDEFNQLLTEKYKYYLKDPKISTTLVESRPFIVYVSGAVVSPGSYEINTNNQNYLTNTEIQVERKSPLLSNVLIASGGLSYDADLEHVQIFNNIDKSTYEVNLLDLLEKRDVNQDIYLMAGDSIHVPKVVSPLAISEEKYKKYSNATFSQKTVPVKVLGYVNEPGLIQLDSSQSLNLNSAISSAGGYINTSAYPPKKVFLSRVDASGKLVTRVINPMSNDVALMPNDIVYIPDKPRPMLGKAVDYATRLMSPINTTAATYNNWALMFNPTRYQVVW